MRGRIALATWAGLPALGPDDQLLAAAMSAVGWSPVATVWDDPTVDWSSFEAVVIRSTWDYYRRRDVFLAWAHRCAQVTQLWNPEGTVAWNTHKAYLFDLASRGLPIVPTERAKVGESLAEICQRRGWGDAVVKPMVSAAADSTFLVREAERDRFEARFAAAVGAAEQIVQPFVPGVAEPGERSLVYIDGRFSHAFRKGPALPIDERERVGQVHVDPSVEELALGDRSVGMVEPRPLYARVDMVQGPEGRPWLMELELVEPYLHWVGSSSSPSALVEALRARLPTGGARD